MYRYGFIFCLCLSLVCCASAQGQNQAPAPGNTTDLRWPVDAQMSTVLVTPHPMIVDPNAQIMTEYLKQHQTWKQRHPKVVKYGTLTGRVLFVGVQVVSSVYNIVR